MDVGVGTKRRIQNPKCEHDTEGGGATAKLPWKFLELWPADSSSKWAAARALHLKMQKYYPLRWLHRNWVVRQEIGERAGYLLEKQRQNRKSTKENSRKEVVYRDKLTVEWTQSREH